MKRVKSIIALVGMMLLILSATSLYVSLGRLSEIRFAESYTDELQNKYYLIVGFSAIYILFYAVVRAILFVWKRLFRKKRQLDGFSKTSSKQDSSESFALEGPDARPHRWSKKKLAILLPVVILAIVLISMSRGGSEAPDMDFGWSGNVWTSNILGLQYTLPTTGVKYDVEKVEADRESKFGRHRSAGQTILAVVDPVENSSLSLIAVIDHPTEKELKRNMDYTIQQLAQGGSYKLIALGEETLAGKTWRAWRIELPERGLVHYYLVRQNGAFWLILSTDSSMSETLPAILTCFEGETSFQTEAAINTYLPPVNEDGYLVATFPLALLGNETAEELVTRFYEDLASVSDMTPEELQAALYWSDIKANEDGGVSYYFTPEQYQKTKTAYYAWGTKVVDEDLFGFNPSDIVKRLEYTDVDEAGIPWAVTAWLNQEYFQDGGVFSDFVARFVPMTIIGRYQIMCGVPVEEWTVHVELRDMETGEILAEGDFPMGE